MPLLVSSIKSCAMPSSRLRSVLHAIEGQETLSVKLGEAEELT
jgi:hypothetical protein